jgi:hypothetical protein
VTAAEPGPRPRETRPGHGTAGRPVERPRRGPGTSGSGCQARPVQAASPSGTLRYYDIIVFLRYHSLDYDIIVNFISMIS